MARIERGERILEDDLHAPAHRAQLRLPETRDVLAVEGDAAAGRPYSLTIARPSVDLPHPDSPDQPERLAPLDREVDAVDGVHVTHVPVEHDAAC